MLQRHFYTSGLAVHITLKRNLISRIANAVSSWEGISVFLSVLVGGGRANTCGIGASFWHRCYRWNGVFTWSKQCCHALTGSSNGLTTAASKVAIFHY